MAKKSFKQILFRRMNTKAQDLLRPDDDLSLIINAEPDKQGALRKVKGYSQVGDQLSAIIPYIIDSTEDFNQGSYTNTESVNGDLILQGGLISQPESNDSYDVYGANWFAQSFTATGAVVRKVAPLLDKVTGSSLRTYDDFEDNSIDTARLTTAGNIQEVGGRLRAVGLLTGAIAQNSSVKTDDKTAVSPPGDPITGFKIGNFTRNRNTAGAGTAYRIELTNGTDSIWIVHLMDVNDMQIELNGVYGSGAVNRWTGTSGSVEIKQANGNIEIYHAGVLRHTIANQNVAANSYFQMKANGGTLTDDNIYIEITDLQVYTSVTDLSDLDVRIETDSGGSPSGTAISTGTIDDAIVYTDKSFVEASVNVPTVPGTVYWWVIKQTGGDSANKYRVYKQNSNLYGDGQVKVSSNSGGAWGEDPDAPSDAAFKIYGDYNSPGTWVSNTITTSAALTQIVIKHRDLSSDNYISQVAILNTDNIVQSSYSTSITSGTLTVLRSSDFSSGFTFTGSNPFRVKVSLVSLGSITPVIEYIAVDSPEKKILLLTPFYQSSGVRALIALVGGTVKRLVSGQWVDIKTGLTSGLETGATIFRAYKQPRLASGDVASADSTSATLSFATEPGVNAYQGKAIRIIAGPGVGQVRIIDSNEGTTTSTSTSTTTSTTTSTSTTAT